MSDTLHCAKCGGTYDLKGSKFSFESNLAKEYYPHKMNEGKIKRMVDSLGETYCWHCATDEARKRLS